MVRTALGTVAALLLVTVGLTVSARGQEPPARTTVWDRVYTGEQATRGETLYQSACSACHAEDLGGSGYAPALKGNEFAVEWGAKSVGAFVETTRRLMPPDNPGSLPQETYRDIAAFILKANNYPAGDKELPGAQELLNTIFITAQP